MTSAPERSAEPRDTGSPILRVGRRRPYPSTTTSTVIGSVAADSGSETA